MVSLKRESSFPCLWLFLLDNKAQASAEFILLFGGIFVVVLLAIFMYKNYMNDLTVEISSKELNEFNSQLNTLGRYFK